MREAKIFNTEYIEIEIGAHVEGNLYKMQIFIPKDRKYDFDEMIAKSIDVKAEKLVDEKIRNRAHRLGENLMKEILTPKDKESL